MESLTIGLDCSTTSAKAVAWTQHGQPVAEGRAELQCSSPQAGHAEQDAQQWVEASFAAIRECVDHCPPDAVRGVGITCQRETFVLLDAEGQPVRPAILWYDARATAELAALQAALGQTPYHARTGKQLDITSAAAKLQWLGGHEPESMRRAAAFADVLAFLSVAFTGNPRTPVCGVDTTGLVSLRAPQWIDSHVAGAGLAVEQLPALVAPCAVLGGLTPRAASRCGLPPGTPIVAGGGDGHCFSLGAELCVPDAATLTLGTSAVLGLHVDKPLIGDAFRTLISCLPGKYLLESVIQCGSATVSWLDRAFAGCTDTPAALDAACANVPPGSDGLLVLPYWRGVRVPHNDPLARGVTAGWTDRHTAAHFRRAVMEGIAFEFAQLLDMVGTSADRAVPALVVGGGGGRSNVWCQILADVLGIPVVRPETVELSALGAALCAMAAAGHTDDPLSVADSADLQASRFEPEPMRDSTSRQRASATN